MVVCALSTGLASLAQQGEVLQALSARPTGESPFMKSTDGLKRYFAYRFDMQQTQRAGDRP